MPKATFLNLPKEKRKKIEDVSFDEFSTYGFDNASINRIVSNARIAKGSFYQYFEDKKDLFLHLFDVAGKAKMSFMSPILMNPYEVSFIDYMREVYRVGIKFSKEYPHAAKVSNMYFRMIDHPVMKEVMSANLDAGNQFFETLLHEAIERGEIKESIDKKFVTHLLISMNLSIAEYFLRENSGSIEYSDNYLDLVEELLDFISNGILVS